MGESPDERLSALERAAAVDPEDDNARERLLSARRRVDSAPNPDNYKRPATGKSWLLVERNSNENFTGDCWCFYRWSWVETADGQRPVNGAPRLYISREIRDGEITKEEWEAKK